MRRRSFVATILAGIAALPFAGKATEKPTEPKQPAATPTKKNIDADCTCDLIHRESYSGNRCKDARIITWCAVHGNPV